MKWILMALLLSGVSLAAGAGPNVAPKDFAYGLSLVGDGSSSLHHFVVPPEVYRGVTRADLGDLRIFNKAGEVVPHAFERLESPPPEADRWEPLSLFPLYEGTKQTPERLSLIIRRESDDGREAVDVSTGQGKSAPKISGYLMDGSGLQGPVKALILNFSGRKNFIRKVDLEASEDLRSWRPLADGAVVAHMNQDGRVLMRNLIEFASVKPAYFRLTLREGGDDPEIENVSVQIDPGVAEPERRWIEVPGTISDGEAVFDTGGFFPADRIEVLLAEPSVLVDSEIASAPTLEGPRRREYTGPVFRLRHGQDEATLGPIVVGTDRRSSRRYWFLKPRNEERTLGVRTPSLRLGWIPERLIFVAQGEGPYVLAYGNPTARPADFGIDSLLSSRRTDNPLKPVEARKAGEVTLGGPSKLLPPPPSQALVWKKALTISLMGLATLGLGLMAYRLARQMNVVERD